MRCCFGIPRSGRDSTVEGVNLRSDGAGDAVPSVPRKSLLDRRHSLVKVPQFEVHEREQVVNRQRRRQLERSEKVALCPSQVPQPPAQDASSDEHAGVLLARLPAEDGRQAVHDVDNVEERKARVVLVDSRSEVGRAPLETLVLTFGKPGKDSLAQLDDTGGGGTLRGQRRWGWKEDGRGGKRDVLSEEAKGPTRKQWVLRLVVDDAEPVMAERG